MSEAYCALNWKCSFTTPTHAFRSTHGQASQAVRCTHSSGVDETPDVMKHVCQIRVRTFIGECGMPL